MLTQRSTETLNVAFEDAQFVVSTNVPEFVTLIRQTYGTRLDGSSTSTVGSLSVEQTGPDEFSITGSERVGADKFHSRHLTARALFQFVKHEIASAFMRARADLLWLHAGAVALDDRAILICGPSGVGKSTLSLALCSAGWQILSDDIAPVSMQDDIVFPYFQGGVKRVYPGRFLSNAGIHELEIESVDIEESRVRQTPARFITVIFPEFRHEEGASLEIMKPGAAALELIRNMTNFAGHGDAAVKRARDISLSLPVYGMKYGDEQAAIDALRGVFR
ncbi:MAG TPA: hypothetical protein VM166_05415 [Gemmatimonadaceae bacterium]|nr:hypothetical protein [Gemmatimonadaceae bacterium]